MPSGYPTPWAVRREFFDLVCSGTPVMQAERRLGVSRNVGWSWWRKAGAMELRKGKGAAGLADRGDPDRPGGRGHRLSLDERITIMRGLDAGLTQSQIAIRIGRDRATVSREIARNRNADGDYHARMAHAGLPKKQDGPRRSNFRTPGCAPGSSPGWTTGGVRS